MALNSANHCGSYVGGFGLGSRIGDMEVIECFWPLLAFMRSEAKSKRHGSQTLEFCCETIHPKQKFTSMNLLQIPWVITWV